MKSRIIDVILVMVVILLLPIGGLLIRAQVPAETFSPPNVGVGRTSVNSEKMHDVETEIESETAIETETETEVETQLETEAVTETEMATEAEPESQEEFVEDTDVLITEELVEVIPAIEGKYLDIPLSAEVQDYARQVSANYGIPFELTMAVCYVESGFDSSAISSTGDYGLMQISYVNHGWLSNELGITDFLDPCQNILAGVHILADKIRESGGDFTTALMRYNRGNAVALQQMSQGIFSTAYTDKVLSKYYEYIREG